MTSRDVLSLCSGDEKVSLVRARRAGSLAAIARAVHAALSPEDEGGVRRGRRKRAPMGRTRPSRRMAPQASELDVQGLLTDAREAAKLVPLIEATQAWLTKGAGDLLPLNEVYRVREEAQKPGRALLSRSGGDPARGLATARVGAAHLPVGPGRRLPRPVDRAVSASGFARDAAHSVFEALRPSADQTLDRAAFATYSLDLVAVAALVLSLGRAGEQELEAGPLSLVDALETIAPRIDIVFQKDRLKPAARHHGVLHMLDRRLHAVRPPRGASYHPKLALVRYLGPREAVTWKLWLGSRNLTGGLDREAGLLLVGRLGGSGGRRMSAIAAMAGRPP